MISTWDTEIREAADKFALPYLMVRAVIEVESGGNQWAWNPEPHYRWFWDVRKQAPFRPLSALELTDERPPRDFPTLAGDPDQEWWAQQASWGLMQVMGAVARERGMRQPYLTCLCNPTIGIEYGCMQLERLQARYLVAEGWDGVLAAYNAGAPRRGPDGNWLNAGYVEKVRAIWA